MDRFPRDLLTFALLVPLALGACQDEVTSPTADLAGDGALPVAGAPAAPQALLSQQLVAVREATRSYRDVSVAVEDGYFAVSPYVPGMGFHFTDALPPFGTDLLDPPVLVYAPNRSYRPEPGEPLDPERMDDLILVAVEYLVPGDQTAAPPNLFSDEDAPRKLRTTEAEGWHFEAAEGFTGLHAWVHRGNPAGVFHSTNPSIP